MGASIVICSLRLSAMNCAASYSADELNRGCREVLALQQTTTHGCLNVWAGRPTTMGWLRSMHAQQLHAVAALPAHATLLAAVVDPRVDPPSSAPPPLFLAARTCVHASTHALGLSVSRSAMA
eukprot:365296-Chlamydomonas_euryale.AAC.3